MKKIPHDCYLRLFLILLKCLTRFGNLYVSMLCFTWVWVCHYRIIWERAPLKLSGKVSEFVEGLDKGYNDCARMVRKLCFNLIILDFTLFKVCWKCVKFYLCDMSSMWLLLGDKQVLVWGGLMSSVFTHFHSAFLVLFESHIVRIESLG